MCPALIMILSGKNHADSMAVTQMFHKQSVLFDTVSLCFRNPGIKELIWSAGDV